MNICIIIREPYSVQIRRYAVEQNDKNSRWKQSNVDISFDFKCRIRILLFALLSHTNVRLILARQSSSKWYFLSVSVHSVGFAISYKMSHTFTLLRSTLQNSNHFTFNEFYCCHLTIRSLLALSLSLALCHRFAFVVSRVTHTTICSRYLGARAPAHKYERVCVRLYLHFEVICHLKDWPHTLPTMRISLKPMAFRQSSI